MITARRDAPSTMRSNYGFMLLGALVERVSGLDYYDYVRDHVFKPAGMTASGSEPEDRVVPGRSKGYMVRNGRLVPNTETLPYRGTPAGGGYTTVGDLARFANALTNHVLLNAAHTALLTMGKADSGQGVRYAYGFVVSGEGGARSFGHSGGAPGMNGDLRIFQSSRLRGRRPRQHRRSRVANGRLGVRTVAALIGIW